jgi:hypothetical protein
MIMKRMILAAGLLIGTSAVAGAQTHRANGSGKTTKYNSTTSHAAKSQKQATTKRNSNAANEKNEVVIPATLLNPATLDPGKMYMWEDGQAATPSGHEAASINNNKVVNARQESNSKQQRDLVNPYLVNPANLQMGKMYMWQNGQAATPTGQEATAVNGGYAALGDSTKRKH